ncbi:MAG: hypothetical protein WAU70_17895 [Flavobacteriales bacterium]
MSRTIVHAAQGFITAPVLVHLPIMAIVIVSGSWIGKQALERMPQTRFRGIVLGLVLLMGLITFFQAWKNGAMGN